MVKKKKGSKPKVVTKGVKTKEFNVLGEAQEIEKEMLKKGSVK
jgi:hypothetical protein